MNRVRLLVVLLVVAGAPAQMRAGTINAQEPGGELRLEVIDPSGRALEVAGNLENIRTGVTRRFQTDAQGSYTFRDLPFGRYRVEVSKDGFARQSVLIDLQSAIPISRSVTMALGNLAFNVEVVATTPLPGGDIESNEIPSPVQVATHVEIEQSGSHNLSDFLNRRFNGVHVNEIQGNPFQPDINYRGYSASPLLGTPQGISVYMDGVRLNQPFGDVMSWDLISRSAISEVTLMPGSNPLFGLNTLGGAISVQTKNGYSQQGTAIELGGGSFGRATIDFEHGGANNKGLSWYLASNLFFEDGWRSNSPSNVRQFFGKLGWQQSKTTLGLTLAYANNALAGNGLQEPRFLERDYTSVYTKPDITHNRAPFLNVSARHSITTSLSVSGNAYYRYISTNTVNGDINEDSLDQALYQPGPAEIAALAAAGYTGFPTSGATAANTPFPFWRCIGNSLLRDEPAEKCNAQINRSRTAQHNYGASGQLTWVGLLRGQRNQTIVGAVYDRGIVHFRQSTQLGYLNPDRSVTGVNSFGDGVSGGSVDGEPYDTRVDLRGLIQTGSIFATNTLSLGSAWSITLSGRYNRTTIDNSDRITPGGGPGSLDGLHTFHRFNPAVGVTFQPLRYLNIYVSYSEGNRAPTSVELGCADPQEPCKLPNAMAGDPPLEQVVTRTLEAGLRGGEEGRTRWNVGWFRGENRNDILFVSSEQTGFGYFKNFGRTRREGLEAEVIARIWRFNLGSGYTFLNATYQSEEQVNGESNSSSDAKASGLEGLIEIDPGARIPLIPRHLLKVFADLQATSKISVNFEVIASSSSFARGNENNEHAPDGTYYIGPGTSPGYAVVNVAARYQINRRLELFVRINNLFDKRYFTTAQLGPTGFTAEGNFIARPFAPVDGEFPLQHATFYAPGAPLGAWGGIRITF